MITRVFSQSKAICVHSIAMTLALTAGCREQPSVPTIDGNVPAAETQESVERPAPPDNAGEAKPAEFSAAEVKQVEMEARSRNPDIRRAALRKLGELAIELDDQAYNDSNITRLLRQSVRHYDKETQLIALDAITKLGNAKRRTGAGVQLQYLFFHEDEEVKEAAIRAYSAISDGNPQ